jgi:mRNA-degrading endonuclease RelE of RelBE toxin-antitoxin system
MSAPIRSGVSSVRWSGLVRQTSCKFLLDPILCANNVVQLVGSPLLRMRIGDHRAIFEETADAITVTKVRPRGSAYD